jgi:tRNA pseudouridine38-40 synthase
MPPQRYKLTIAYRGTRYHGWQKQLPNQFYRGPAPSSMGLEGIPTIQELLAKAVARVVNHPVNIVGSSRTDTGVHAKGQVAHVDSGKPLPPYGLLRAVNARLPDDIAVVKAELAPPTFDAIASTLSKRYQYLLWQAPVRPVFYGDLSWHHWQPLDLEAMREAAAHFVGTRDFAALAKAGHRRESTIRSVYTCEVSWRLPRIVISTEGGGFLWNMVRIMAGTLAEVGAGRIKPHEIPSLLDSKDRRSAGKTAPAQGLFLQWVRYPADPAEAPPTDAEAHLPSAPSAVD